MRLRILIISLIISFAFTSCNWNMYSSDSEKPDSGSSGSIGITNTFTGEAPRNVYASQSNFNGYVVVSFDAVSGADSYDVERIIIDRSSSEAEIDNTAWRIIRTLPSESGVSRYTYRDEAASDGSKIYLYRVKANSLFAELSQNIKAEYSEVVRGWPLSPPVSLTATQGTYTDRIILEWSRMELVKGYDLYYYVPEEGTAEVWNKANSSTIPSSYGSDTILYSFYPDEDAYGSDIYFKVRSISRGGSISNDSGYRTGYTFKVGAPLAPENLEVGDAVSSIYIPISWDQPEAEGTEGESYYRWEITRSTPTTDEETVIEFNSNSVPTEVSIEGGSYIYEDKMSSGDIAPGIVYTYTVRAVLVETKGTETEELIGIAASDTGCLVNPAVTIGETHTEYPSATNKGKFSFTIAAPPAEYSEASNWTYRIYGRYNELDRNIGEWQKIQDIPVTFNPVTVEVDYGTYKVNEFDLRIVDSEGEESVGYAEYIGEPIVTERAPAPSVSLLTVTKNKFSSTLRPNTSGVYPVTITIGNDSTFTEYQIEGVSSSGRSMGTKTIKNNETLTDATFSPTTPGESWMYRLRGTDVFDRYSAWSDGVEGYGALTGETFIKFFEKYVLKPWEFVNAPDFPASLKTKWNASEIKTKIDAKGTGSLTTGIFSSAIVYIYENSDYHGGRLGYASRQVNAAGDIHFSYENFGELEILCGNGSYNMTGVNMSGNNGSCTGTVKVTGMYPATVDFSSLKVASYAFSGKYKLTQDNGKGMEEVEATRNV